MSDKYGQAIGGIKTQQKILREKVEQLRYRVRLLICLNLVYYVTMITIYCMRHYD